MIVLPIYDPAADDGVGYPAFADRPFGKRLRPQQVVSGRFVCSDVAHVDEPLHVHLSGDI